MLKFRNIGLSTFDHSKFGTPPISNMHWIYFIPKQSFTNILHGYKLVRLPYIDFTRISCFRIKVSVKHFHVTANVRSLDYWTKHQRRNTEAVARTTWHVLSVLPIQNPQARSYFPHTYPAVANLGYLLCQQPRVLPVTFVESAAEPSVPTKGNIVPVSKYVL